MEELAALSDGPALETALRPLRRAFPDEAAPSQTAREIDWSLPVPRGTCMCSSFQIRCTRLKLTLQPPNASGPAEVRRYGSEDGQAGSGAPEGELVAEEVGGGSGPRHVDPQGGRPPKLTCPERRRRTVESVRRTLGQEKVSERRVCRVPGQNRGTQRHRPRKVDGDRELLGVMRKPADRAGTQTSIRTPQAHRMKRDAHHGNTLSPTRVILRSQSGAAGRQR